VEKERLTRTFVAPKPQPKAPAVEPQPVDAYTQRLNSEMERGNRLLNAGLHRQAVVHFKTMCKKYPCDARITLKIGLAYKALKEYGAAYDYMQKAIAQGIDRHRYSSMLMELKSLCRNYAGV
jgi:tetratricopeptide (TPR) repeat protein